MARAKAVARRGGGGAGGRASSHRRAGAGGGAGRAPSSDDGRRGQPPSPASRIRRLAAPPCAGDAFFRGEARQARAGERGPSAAGQGRPHASLQFPLPPLFSTGVAGGTPPAADAGAGAGEEGGDPEASLAGEFTVRGRGGREGEKEGEGGAVSLFFHPAGRPAAAAASGGGRPISLALARSPHRLPSPSLPSHSGTSPTSRPPQRSASSPTPSRWELTPGA